MLLPLWCWSSLAVSNIRGALLLDVCQTLNARLRLAIPTGFAVIPGLE